MKKINKKMLLITTVRAIAECVASHLKEMETREMIREEIERRERDDKAKSVPNN